jgi:hypothetical protein
LVRKVLKRLDRDESLRTDFPPHRHISGEIIYPRDYEPAMTQKLQGARFSRSDNN